MKFGGNGVTVRGEFAGNAQKFVAPPKRAIFDSMLLEFHPTNCSRRKVNCQEWSETRFGKVSHRSEPSSRGKRPFKVSQKFDSENFKRPKNREDSSDLDENLTESIAAMKTFISKNFVAAGLQKNCFKKFRRASCCLNIYRCFHSSLRVLGSS